MSEKFSLTQTDFAARFARFTTPEAIPMTYKIGDTVYQGIPAGFSPVVKAEKNPKSDKIRRTVIEGTSPEGLTVRVEYEEYEDYPVTEWLAFFSNESDADTPALSDIRYELSVLNQKSGARPVLTHGIGEAWEDCYAQFPTKLNHEVRLESDECFSCFKVSPYMRLVCGGETGNPTGENLTVAISVGWPASWYGSFVPCIGGVRMAYGFPRLNVALRPGEVIRTMRMTYLTTVGDEAKSRNAWRRWCFDYIVPRDGGKRLDPMLALICSNADATHQCFEGATEESLLTGFMDYVNAGLRPDVWWIDAGWYACKSWKDIGVWSPDPARFPRGFAPVGELCEKYGTKFLVWFEPERVRLGTAFETEHPDMVTRAKNPATGDDFPDGLYYLGDRRNLASIIDRIDATIKESHIHFYREDWNFWPRLFFLELEGGDENRAGAPENFHTQGYLALWDALVERNPGLLIDSCAGGGKRNDLETMRRAVTLHFTDWGYGDHPIKQRQYRTHFEWIPYFRTTNMSWDNPDGTYPPSRKGATRHPFADRFAYHNAMAPALTTTTAHNASPEEFAVAREMIAIWRRAADIELRGDYYPLSDTDSDASVWYAAEFYDPDAGDGFIQFVRNTKCENDTFTAFPFAEDGASYTLTNPETGESFVKSAAELEAGLTVTLPPRSGVLYFIKKN